MSDQQLDMSDFVCSNQNTTEHRHLSGSGALPSYECLFVGRSRPENGEKADAGFGRTRFTNQHETSKESRLRLMSRIQRNPTDVIKLPSLRLQKWCCHHCHRQPLGIPSLPNPPAAQPLLRLNSSPAAWSPEWVSLSRGFPPQALVSFAVQKQRHTGEVGSTDRKVRLCPGTLEMISDAPNQPSRSSMSQH